MTNQDLYEKALSAINDLFSDTSVSVDKAIENLESLKDEIDVLISALDENKDV